MQIVEPRLAVVVIAAETERIFFRDPAAPARRDIPPQVVFIARFPIPVGVVDRRDVAEDVLPEVVRVSVVNHARDARLVVDVVLRMRHRTACVQDLFRDDLIPFQILPRRDPVHRLFIAQAVGIVFIREAVALVIPRGKLRATYSP